MLIAYELKMPRVGSWNGNWSAEKNLHVLIRRYSKQPTFLVKNYWSYNFGDGWYASIHAMPVTSKEAAKLRKASKGFCGYDWMIDSIEMYGEILNDITKGNEPMEQDYTQENWNTETRRYYCTQNGLGQWWPMLKVKTNTVSGLGWCQIIIRDSNPFKTLNGAIKYIEKHREQRKQS